MNELYLTILQDYVPAIQPMSAQEEENETNPAEFSLKYYLFPTAEHFKSFLAASQDLLTAELPILPNPGYHAIIDLIKNLDLDLQDIELLFYCHETLEPSFVVPALKIKQLFEMDTCLPLMISQNGSLSSLNAITLAKAALSKQKPSEALIVIVDRVEFAALRYQFNGFMRGDQLALLLLSQTKGDYKVLGIQKIYDCLEIPYPHWNGDDYREDEQKLILNTNELLRAALDFNIDYVVCHQLSSLFCEAVELWCERASIPLLTRKEWQGVNLLGSDPYISLMRLEEEDRIPSNSKILLLFASIDFGVGYLILLKE